MRRSIAAPALALGVVFSPACSAVVGVVPDECFDSAFCRTLNLRDGLPLDGCEIWQCEAPAPGQPGVCVRGPRDYDDDDDVAARCGGTDCDDADVVRAGSFEEACDLVDNDCDFLVDESSLVPGEVARSAAGALTAAYSEHSAIALQPGAMRRASHVPLLDSGFGSAAPIGYWPRSLNGPMETGCLGNPNEQTSSSMASCDVVEAAIASRADRAPIVAAISRSGCASGALRVGALVGDEIDVVGRTTSPDATSNVFPVVDRPAGSVCTGTFGATRPAIEALASGTYGRVLAAWLDASSASYACGGPEAEVHVMGLLTMSRFVGVPEVEFFAGTDGGVATALGMTTGATPPALGAVGSDGWLVAFGTSSGLEVHWLSAFPDAISESPALADPVQVVTVAGGPARSVDLAVGASGEVAVVWSDACDSSGMVRFASFDFAPTSPVVTGAVEAVSLGVGMEPAILEGPSAVTADDPDLASRGTTWLVAMGRADGVGLLRVLDGAPVDEVAVAAPGASEPRLVAASDGTVRLFARASVDPSTAADLVEVRAACAMGP